jgi:3-phosphoshikimate 1-carboxyvinyltransferase
MCGLRRAGATPGKRFKIAEMSHSEASKPLLATRGAPLSGRADCPGDKSVSHRALILSALTVGESRIRGLLEADDVLNTAESLRRMGASVVRHGTGEWRVSGMGVGGFSAPKDVLDFGNSGTGCRLVMGAMATTPIAATFTGDASLQRRPMKRVLDPLSEFGATWQGRDGGLLPVTIAGTGQAVPITYKMPVASAQVKSAVLLAALNAPGRTTVFEKAATRDHTERMLAAFGAQIAVNESANGASEIMVTGQIELKPTTVIVPRDPSSAAFPLVAALIVPGSDVTVEGVMLNARRTGLFLTLSEMGADVTISNRKPTGGDEIGDIRARFSPNMKGVDVPPERAPTMIDEYPVLAVAAAFASGRTHMRGLEELRVKESDRLAAIVAGLRGCGVAVEDTADGMIVNGKGVESVAGGGHVETHMDHRIAMSFLVLGLASKTAVTVDDGSMIATSFPDFESLMRGLGADIAPAP